MTKKRIRIILVLFILLCVLAGCNKSTVDAQDIQGDWQEQYDLGIRYLSEGNYEEAIIAFTNAIEIDPKQAPAYVGRGDAYVLNGETDENLVAAKADYDYAMELDSTNATVYLGLSDICIRLGDWQTAEEILHLGSSATNGKDVISQKLEEFTGETIRDSAGMLRICKYYKPDGTLSYYTYSISDMGNGTTRQDSYSAEGTLTKYTLYYSSEDGMHFYSENFDSDGNSNGKSLRVEDEKGKWIYSTSLDVAGNESSHNEALYDESGECLGWDTYIDGKLTGYAHYEGGKTIYYDADGKIKLYAD